MNDLRDSSLFPTETGRVDYGEQGHPRECALQRIDPPSKRGSSVSPGLDSTDHMLPNRIAKLPGTLHYNKVLSGTDLRTDPYILETGYSEEVANQTFLSELQRTYVWNALSRAITIR
ncbi:hypothetical protein TNCV_24101 [Trichonephila clavipes]|nr:hypothetical protein TNCV_24101 [Trichonephila clavipes]